MKSGYRTVAVGWEYEVPVEEIQAARSTLQEELESHFFTSVDSLTDTDVARFLVRTAHPTTRYLKPNSVELGFRLRLA